MPARFILSLDCEGKWGVADLLSKIDTRSLSDQALRRAYEGIAQLLDRCDIPATFAFVGLFGETAEQFAKVREGVEVLAAKAPHYLRPALDEIDGGSPTGWHGAWAVDLIGAANARHEIALHGVSHVPWGKVGEDFVREELRLLEMLSGPVKGSKTFVYPRNDVGHAHLLPSAGIRGYRLAARARSRASSLLSEFNVRSPSERDGGIANGLVEIPAGYFVNWQSGLRKTVPHRLTRKRVIYMLDHAERTNGVVHLWLHPENIATAPTTLSLLAGILTLVADRRDQGRCRILRQIDYVAERTRSAAAEAA